MDQRVSYDIIHCSSQDDEFPIFELAQGSPSSVADAASSSSIFRTFKGWQSARNAKMPQTIVLRFPGNVELVQLRILNHEYKIASKVEVQLFALKGAGMEANPPSFRTIRFVKLGVVDFNSNEHSNYRSKERKTIHLQATAYFVKLLFDTPHHNAQNVFHQVGVYSIECIGKILSRVLHHFDAALVNSDLSQSWGPVEPPHQPSLESPSPSQPRQQQQRELTPLGQRPHKGGQMSMSPPLTPLCDIIPQSGDVPTFRSVRILEFEDFFVRRSEELLALKDQAVAFEDFDTAKECRDRINLMNRRSKRIYQLEHEKVQAIIDEDFDTAKEVKRMMDGIIEKVYEDARLPRPRPDFDPYNCICELSSESLCSKNLPIVEEKNEDAVLVAASVTEAGPVFKGNDDPNDHLQKEEIWEDINEKSEKEDEVRLGSNDSNTPSNAQKTKRHPQKIDKSKTELYNVACYDNEAPIDYNNRDNTEELVQPFINDEVNEWPQKNDANDGKYNDEKINNHNYDDCEEALSILDETRMEVWERCVAEAILATMPELKGPEDINSVVKTTREVLDLFSTVGVFTTCCLFSKRFKLREEALNVLGNKMTELYEAQAQPAAIEEAVLRFLDMNGYGLQDAIPGVVAAGCGFVRVVLEDKYNCLSSVIVPVVNLLPRLLCCAADANPRTRDEALATLSLCMKAQPVANHTILSAVLADPMDKEKRRLPNSCTRVQIARLTVLEQLLSTGRMASHTFVKNVWTKLLLPCVNHQNREVRDLAVLIITHLVREQKLVISEKLLNEIGNMVIRDQVRSLAGRVKPFPLIAKSNPVLDPPAKGETSNKATKDMKKGGNKPK